MKALATIFGDAHRLAVEHGLSGYDAAYLEVAIRKGLPLATLDEDLQKAAQAAGVERSSRPGLNHPALPTQAIGD
ncbi:MAG: type II toxin-antitoxin system VapC family toxin [Bryobacteraceae bacterium]